jgi:hypothetical protein
MAARVDAASAVLKQNRQGNHIVHGGEATIVATSGTTAVPMTLLVMQRARSSIDKTPKNKTVVCRSGLPPKTLLGTPSVASASAIPVPDRYKFPLFLVREHQNYDY